MITDQESREEYFKVVELLARALAFVNVRALPKSGGWEKNGSNLLRP